MSAATLRWLNELIKQSVRGSRSARVRCVRVDVKSAGLQIGRMESQAGKVRCLCRTYVFGTGWNFEFWASRERIEGHESHLTVLSVHRCLQCTRYALCSAYVLCVRVMCAHGCTHGCACVVLACREPSDSEQGSLLLDPGSDTGEAATVLATASLMKTLLAREL